MTNSAGRSGEPSLRAELKQLLENVSTSVDYVSEDDQRTLLGSLREWQRGDRRKRPRKACSILVKVGAWRVYTDYVRNISTGGVFIETSAPFSREEQVTLMLSLPNEKGPVRITGHVAWTTAQGIGVQFKQPLGKKLERAIDAL